MKKIAIIGIMALVVIGCVLAAGCTSTSTTPASSASTTSTDSVVGTWTLPNGTTVVFSEDFKGVMTTGDNKINFTWKKTTDGKYQVDNEKGEQVLWTMDSAKNSMTNAAGMVLSKKASSASGTMNDTTNGGIEIVIDTNGNKDFVVGTWTLPDETTVSFTSEFSGLMKASDGTKFNFTWKKTDDGKYQVTSEDGVQTLWTPNNDGTMTSSAGDTLTKKSNLVYNMDVEFKNIVNNNSQSEVEKYVTDKKTNDTLEQVTIHLQGADLVYIDKDTPILSYEYLGDRKTIEADVGSKLWVSPTTFTTLGGSEFKRLCVHYVENGEEKTVDVASSRDEGILNYVNKVALYTDANYTNELVSKDTQIEVTKDMDGKTYYSNYGDMYSEHGTVYDDSN